MMGHMREHSSSKDLFYDGEHARARLQVRSLSFMGRMRENVVK
jgi:hypothetical protein